jgi:hypothetical protein
MNFFGVCNYQNKYCGCQTYMEDEIHSEKCFYCNHYIAFHTGFSSPSQSTSTPQLGACQKDGISCGCQAFVAGPNDELKCKYCDHFIAFHKSADSIIRPSSSESILPFSLPSLHVQNSFTSGYPRSRAENTKSIKKRKRIPSKFRNKNTSIKVSRGRPSNVSLRLNHLLLFAQESWENNSAPRENTSAWIEMRNNGFIIEDVLFYENTVESIDSLITSHFPLVKKRDYILLNGSTSKLKAATNQVKYLHCH